ncbi:hypothetical protein AB0L06_41955 [Spirillospora sp. NPDC052269]
MKFGEEAGELHSEVLGFVRHQKAQKLERFTQESVADEIADMIICAAILAVQMGVDPQDAVRARSHACHSDQRKGRDRPHLPVLRTPTPGTGAMRWRNWRPPRNTVRIVARRPGAVGERPRAIP